MTDKTERDIFRGERAARLLEDELLQEAFATIEQEYTNQWLASPARDHEGREKLYLMVKTLHRFRSELAAVVETGKLAQHNLTLAQKARQIGAKLKPF